MKRLFPLLLLLLLLLAAPAALALDDEPHEHVFGDWYTVTDATCTEAGEERRDCANCDANETRTIPMTEHAFGEVHRHRRDLHRSGGRTPRLCELRCK